MNEKGRGGEILGGNVLICQRDVLLVRFSMKIEPIDCGNGWQGNQAVN
jgi:hypothetical protein